jgi:hypothetical protein
VKRSEPRVGVQLDLADPLRDLVLVVEGPDVRFALPAAGVRRCASLDEVDIADAEDAAQQTGAGRLGEVLVGGVLRPLLVLPELLPRAGGCEVAVLLSDAAGGQPGELLALGPVVAIERRASLQIAGLAEGEESEPPYAALCRGRLEARTPSEPPLWLLDPQRLDQALASLRERAA